MRWIVEAKRFASSKDRGMEELKGERIGDLKRTRERVLPGTVPEARNFERR